jgi:hypothetical protein
VKRAGSVRVCRPLSGSGCRKGVPESYISALLFGASITLMPSESARHRNSVNFRCVFPKRNDCVQRRDNSPAELRGQISVTSLIWRVEFAKKEGHFLRYDIILIRDLEYAGAAFFLSVSTILRSLVGGFAFINARENIRRIVRTAGRFSFVAFGVVRALRIQRVSRSALCDVQ